MHPEVAEMTPIDELNAHYEVLIDEAQELMKRETKVTEEKIVYLRRYLDKVLQKASSAGVALSPWVENTRTDLLGVEFGGERFTKGIPEKFRWAPINNSMTEHYRELVKNSI